jgi:hypothetical protein
MSLPQAEESIRGYCQQKCQNLPVHQSFVFANRLDPSSFIISILHSVSDKNANTIMELTDDCIAQIEQCGQATRLDYKEQITNLWQWYQNIVKTVTLQDPPSPSFQPCNMEVPCGSFHFPTLKACNYDLHSFMDLFIYIIQQRISSEKV